MPSARSRFWCPTPRGSPSPSPFSATRLLLEQLDNARRTAGASAGSGEARDRAGTLVSRGEISCPSAGRSRGRLWGESHDRRQVSLRGRVRPRPRDRLGASCSPTVSAGILTRQIVGKLNPMRPRRLARTVATAATTTGLARCSEEKMLAL